MMENKPYYYNNPVFTMPGNKPAKDETLPAGKYLKAVKGSFDEGFFKDAVTGEFCFPDYNKHWKGVVQLKDHTNYQQGNSLDEFEYYFFSPVFGIPGFESFLEHLPVGYYPSGIDGEKLAELFEEFDDFVKGDIKATKYFERYKEPSLLVNAGLIEPIDLSTLRPADVWDEVAPVTIREICIANGIQPVNNNDHNIQNLVDRKVAFPYTFYRPAELLKQLYAELAELYVEDIRKGTDHFHPLYLQPLWEEVKRSCGNEDIGEKADKILQSKFWKQRLSYEK